MNNIAKIVILTGAGISAESGISTFRDSNGLWEEHEVEKVCSYDSLEKNEKLTIKFYNQRRSNLEDKKPNHAHKVIASLKEKYFNDIVIITQNVDNLFEKAGIEKKDVIHLHGFLTEIKCTSCNNILDIGYQEQSTLNNYLCSKCNSKLRPNIVFFGEEAPQYELLNYHIHHCELLVIIGTSGNVLDLNTLANSVNTSILNNLEKTWVINEDNFTKTLYQKATTAIDEIQEDIIDFLHNTNKPSNKKRPIYLNEIDLAQQAIQDADAILITAGAGMGVDSGLPDFRGNKGLWTTYPPIKKLGYDFKQMESSSLFRTNAKLAWGFYGHRLNLYRDTRPNLGFSLLKEMINVKKDNYFIFTSNVDGHFQKAGFSAEKIYEIHGSIEYLQCIDNCSNKILENDLERISVDMDKLEAKDIPKCRGCGNTLMPNILMFGDGLFSESRVSKQNDRFKRWLKSTKGLNIVILEIGAGRTIPTIRNFNDSYSKKNNNVKLIRINPVEYEVWNNKDIGIKGKGLETLHKIKSDSPS